MTTQSNERNCSRVPRQWQKWLFPQGVHAPLVPGCPAGTERLHESEFTAALMRCQMGHQSRRCALFIHKSLTFKEMAKTLNRKEVVAESPRHVLRDALGEAMRPAGLPRPPGKAGAGKERRCSGPFAACQRRSSHSPSSSGL